MENRTHDKVVLNRLTTILGTTEKQSRYNEHGDLIALSFSGSSISQLPPEIGLLTSLQVLDLSRTRLNQLPPEIGLLTSLQTLYLNYTQLRQLPPEIGLLTSLQKLYISRSTLRQLPPEIGLLTSLQRLFLSGTQINRLPIAIRKCTSLQALNLSSTQISQLPPEIGLLTSLQSLDLSDIQISQLPPEIGQLTGLRSFFLNDTPISQLPPEIGQLTSLQELDLSGTLVNQLPSEIGQLAGLWRFDLSGTQISQLPPEIGQLTGLRSFFLNDTPISQLPPEVGQLTSLQELDLSSTRISQLPPEIGQLTGLQRLGLHKNPALLTPPPEIQAQGTQEVLVFLQALQQNSVRRYEAKLLFVGEGGTGKSSLLRLLRGEAFDAFLRATHGIEIETLHLSHLSLPECFLVLNAWDFGGQDIYRATHQFFLTKRSLYLVVWNARMGDEQSKLDFWLKTISAYAPEAPVLLIATHIDECMPDLNVQQYRSAYPQIVEVLQVSNKTGEGLQNLQNAIAQQAAKLPLMGQSWPTSWIEVERTLLALSEHHIDVNMYINFCKERGVETKIAQGTLASYLHDLGKLLFFRDDPLLNRIVILKPNWITKAISRVLEDGPTKKAKGILAHIDFPRIWGTHEDGQIYERALYPTFLRLMECFDLSYQITSQIPGTSSMYSLIPQLLPHEPPPDVSAWSIPKFLSQQISIEMIYRFDFVPVGIMSWFIARTHQYTRNIHWREGAVLMYRDHWARVELFPRRKELCIAVWGIQPYTFFVILKETLDLILARFSGLVVRREVPCICHRLTHSTSVCQEVYRYEEDLVKRLERGKQTIQCRSSDEDVSVIELVYGLHIVTTPQIMARVEKGQQEILQRLNALQQYDEILLQQISQLCEWNVRNFTRLWNLEMQNMGAEYPNIFFLLPDPRSHFNPKNWISQNYKLYLICQHPPGPHCVDDKYSYDLRPSREWWIKISPWLRRLSIFIKFGLPFIPDIKMGDIIDIDTVDFKNAETQLKLLKQISEELSEITRETIEEHSHAGQVQTIGPALRFLHTFLKDKDPQQFWGGLEKVITPDGNILWLCPQHAHLYKAQPLSLP